MLTQWITNVSECIEQKKAKLPSSNICSGKIILLRKIKKFKSITDLHNRLAITPTDKANANVTLICKRFYSFALFRALRITLNQQTNMNILRILIMRPFLKTILMAFLDTLEFLFQKITNIYYQFTGYLTTIRIQPKLTLLLQLQHDM